MKKLLANPTKTEGQCNDMVDFIGQLKKEVKLKAMELNIKFHGCESYVGPLTLKISLKDVTNPSIAVKALRLAIPAAEVEWGNYTYLNHGYLYSDQRVHVYFVRRKSRKIEAQKNTLRQVK